MQTTVSGVELPAGNPDLVGLLLATSLNFAIVVDEVRRCRCVRQHITFLSVVVHDSYGFV